MGPPITAPVDPNGHPKQPTSGEHLGQIPEKLLLSMIDGWCRTVANQNQLLAPSGSFYSPSQAVQPARVARGPDDRRASFPASLN